MTGQEKIAALIVEKAQGLVLSLAPKLSQMALELGIQNFGTPNVQLPNICPPKDIIDKIIFLRNNLYDKLNSTSRTIENLSKPIDVANTVVTTTSKTVTALNVARNAALLALEITPPGVIIPGQVITGISRLDDLVTFLNPKIVKAQAIVSSMSLALDFANAVLVKILSFFKIIDELLAKCSPAGSSTPPPVSGYIVKAEQRINELNNGASKSFSQLYKGFALDIEEEQFSPTVKRIRAVAKNTSGIILLSTPFSFTTDSQSLIEQLKLIIDTNDLKAY